MKLCRITVPLRFRQIFRYAASQLGEHESKLEGAFVNDVTMSMTQI